MRKPRVLIGYSRCQLTRQAFEDVGCEAYTCDLLPLPEDKYNGRHLIGDVWFHIRMGPWDMAVFHPMCTYLTVSAAWAFNDPDFERYPGVGYHQSVKSGTLVGAARHNAREEAVCNFKRLMKLPFPKACENPGKSFLNTMYRKPDQLIQPHQFGDDASKETGLWLDGLPPLVLRTEDQVPPRMVGGKPRWANQTDSGQNKLTPGDDRWLERSKTYPGIARAMGSQWGKFIVEKVNA